MPRYRIFFRGDSRPPEAIFKEGFQPKYPSSGYPLKFRGCETSEESVSISESHKAAAAFPCDPKTTEGAKPNTWIYLVVVDTERNTQEYLNVFEAGTTHCDNRHANAGLFLAQEHIVNHISACDVLSAFPITRLQSQLPYPGTLSFEHYTVDAKAIQNKDAKSDQDTLHQLQQIEANIAKEIGIKQTLTISPLAAVKLALSTQVFARLQFFNRQKYAVTENVMQQLEKEAGEKIDTTRYLKRNRLLLEGIMQGHHDAAVDFNPKVMDKMLAQESPSITTYSEGFKQYVSMLCQADAEFKAELDKLPEIKSALQPRIGR